MLLPSSCSQRPPRAFFRRFIFPTPDFQQFFFSRKLKGMKKSVFFVRAFFENKTLPETLCFSVPRSRELPAPFFFFSPKKTPLFFFPPRAPVVPKTSCPLIAQAFPRPPETPPAVTRVFFFFLLTSSPGVPPPPPQITVAPARQFFKPLGNPLRPSNIYAMTRIFPNGPSIISRAFKTFV